MLRASKGYKLSAVFSDSLDALGDLIRRETLLLLSLEFDLLDRQTDDAFSMPTGSVTPEELPDKPMGFYLSLKACSETMEFFLITLFYFSGTIFLSFEPSSNCFGCIFRVFERLG